MMNKKLWITLVAGTTFILSRAQNIPLHSDDFIAHQVSVVNTTNKDKTAVKVQIPSSLKINDDRTLAILKNTDFHKDTIEATISGQPLKSAGETARGFVGIAFRTTGDASKMEVFYLRPTNGRANDQVRRNHSTQYISVPGYPWEKLRKESPEKYEAYADMVPGEWIKVKVEIKDETAKL